MDRPELPRDDHERALCGIARINRWSLTSRRVWRRLRQLAAVHRLDRLRVLEAACGDGNLSIDLARRAKRAGASIELTGFDVSAVAVACAQRNAAAAGLDNVTFFRADALADDLGGEYDIAVSSLFLHHLAEDAAVRLLCRLRNVSRYAVIMDDVRRSTSGYWLARWGCRLLTSSPVVHFDAPASVRSALTPEEALELAQRAGWDDVCVARRWPQRYVLEWRNAA